MVSVYRECVESGYRMCLWEVFRESICAKCF